MIKEIALKQKCLLLRSGIRIFIKDELVEKLNRCLTDPTIKFLDVENNIVNKTEIVGLFDPELLEDSDRIKRGQWKCTRGGIWHDKGERCDCKSEKEISQKSKGKSDFYDLHGYYPPK